MVFETTLERIFMDDFKNTIVIHDNCLTTELRNKCELLINEIKQLPLKDRRLRYEELNSLFKELLENKNKNYRDLTKKVSEMPFVCPTEIASILDNETEKYIDEIFKILTNKLD